MSDDSGDDDKQYEASQKKLDDARRKGEIAKSNDLITAAAYAGLLLILVAFGAPLMTALGNDLMLMLDQPDALASQIFAGSPQPVLGSVFWKVGLAAAPLFALPAALAVLAIVAQRALVFAPDKVVPKLSRISMISGAKNKFGRQGLFEFIKSFAKLCLYGVVLGIYLIAQQDRIIATVALTPRLAVAELGKLSVTLMFIVTVIAFILGAVDFLWQRAEHQRKHRMSRKELMDEMKQSDGDPAMKQQRRQKGFDIAMNSMLAKVPDAQVIVVNPTHYAIALSWDRMAGTAPICVAKGVDEIAAAIRRVASENAVPIHSDPPTARAIFATVDIGAEVAPDHYKAVAAAIRFAEAMRAKQKGRVYG